MKSEKLHELSKIIVSQEIIVKKIGKNIYIVNPEIRSVVILNETSSFIWTHIQKKTTIKKVVEKLISEYDVDVDRAEKDIFECIQRFIQYKIVITSSNLKNGL